MGRESPFRRPYASRRRREKAKRHLLSREDKNKLMLRLLVFLVVVLSLSLAIIFKDTGKSEIATGTLMSSDR